MPGNARDDERHGERVEKDGAEDSLRTDILVDEDGEKKAEDQAAGYEQHAEYSDVLGGDQEAVIGEQSAVLSETDPVQLRQESRSS